MGVWRNGVRGLCRDAADFGSVRRHVDGDVQPADAVPELDLRGSCLKPPQIGIARVGGRRPGAVVLALLRPALTSARRLSAPATDAARSQVAPRFEWRAPAQ